MSGNAQGFTWGLLTAVVPAVVLMGISTRMLTEQGHIAPALWVATIVVVVVTCGVLVWVVFDPRNRPRPVSSADDLDS